MEDDDYPEAEESEPELEIDDDDEYGEDEDEEYGEKKQKRKSTNSLPKSPKRAKKGNEEALESPLKNWDQVTNLEELRTALKAHEKTIEALRKEIASLKKGQPKAAAKVKQVDPETMAAQLKRTISASLNKQLTYKNGGQKYRASNLSVSLPGVSEDAFKKLFGEDLIGSGSNGPKMSKFTLSADDAGKTIGNLHKSLRYGASLEPVWPLNVSFSKSSQMLKINGKYLMMK